MNRALRHGQTFSVFHHNFLLSWCSLDGITLCFQSCSSWRCSLRCGITRHESSQRGTAGQALGKPNPFISLCAQVPTRDLAEVGGRMISLRHQPGTRSPSLCLGEWTILLSWPWGCAGFQGGKGMEHLLREDQQRCSLNGFSWQPRMLYSTWPLPIGKVFPVLWGYLFRCKQLITKWE